MEMQKIILENTEISNFYSTEAYNTLRTNLQFSGKGIKSIAFTSCVAREGKSVVAFQTACSLAGSGKRTVYVDCDMRKSITASRYKIDSETSGISEFIVGEKSYDEILYSSNIEKLFVVFPGCEPPNPSELLATEDFNVLILKLRDEFDYVIIDLPPLGVVIDAAIAARACDGAVMVIASDTVSRKLAKKVIRQLEASNCKILGSVLNMAEISKKNYERYGYYCEK